MAQDFFSKLRFSDVFVLVVLYHSANIEKKILRINPQIKTWVLLGNKPTTFGSQLIIWAKREFLVKFHLNEFYQIIVTCQAAKFGRRICTGYPGHMLSKCWVNIEQKLIILVIGQSQDFLVNLSHSDQLVVPFQAAKFEKDP